MDAAVTGPGQIPATVEVICGSLRGTYDVAKTKIIYLANNGGIREATPTLFERLGGRQATKKWKQSIRVVDASGQPGKSLGEWLAGTAGNAGESSRHAFAWLNPGHRGGGPWADDGGEGLAGGAGGQQLTSEQLREEYVAGLEDFLAGASDVPPPGPGRQPPAADLGLVAVGSHSFDLRRMYAAVRELGGYSAAQAIPDSWERLALMLGLDATLPNVAHACRTAYEHYLLRVERLEVAREVAGLPPPQPRGAPSSPTASGLSQPTTGGGGGHRSGQRQQQQLPVQHLQEDIKPERALQVMDLGPAASQRAPPPPSAGAAKPQSVVRRGMHPPMLAWEPRPTGVRGTGSHGEAGGAYERHGSGEDVRTYAGSGGVGGSFGSGRGPYGGRAGRNGGSGGFDAGYRGDTGPEYDSRYTAEFEEAGGYGGSRHDLHPGSGYDGPGRGEHEATGRGRYNDADRGAYDEAPRSGGYDSGHTGYDDGGRAGYDGGRGAHGDGGRAGYGPPPGRGHGYGGGGRGGYDGDEAGGGGGKGGGGRQRGAPGASDTASLEQRLADLEALLKSATGLLPPPQPSQPAQSPRRFEASYDRRPPPPLAASQSLPVLDLTQEQLLLAARLGLHAAAGGNGAGGANGGGREVGATGLQPLVLDAPGFGGPRPLGRPQRPPPPPHPTQPQQPFGFGGAVGNAPPPRLQLQQLKQLQLGGPMPGGSAGGGARQPQAPFPHADPNAVLLSLASGLGGGPGVGGSHGGRGSPALVKVLDHAGLVNLAMGPPASSSAPVRRFPIALNRGGSGADAAHAIGAGGAGGDSPQPVQLAGGWPVRPRMNPGGGMQGSMPGGRATAPLGAGELAAVAAGAAAAGQDPLAALTELLAGAAGSVPGGLPLGLVRTNSGNIRVGSVGVGPGPGGNVVLPGGGYKRGPPDGGGGGEYGGGLGKRPAM